MTSPDVEKYRQLARQENKDWRLAEGLLYFKGRLYVPDKDDLRARLLDEIHRQPSTAHPGRNKMKILVRVYWETRITAATANPCQAVATHFHGFHDVSEG